MGVSNRKLFTVRRRIHISRKFYSTKVDSKYRQIFENKRLNHSADTSAVLFTVHGVVSLVRTHVPSISRVRTNAIKNAYETFLVRVRK